MAEEKSRNGKYEAILRAAARVFARSGYFNAKVSDVARTAGVADGTVYLYFKNKDDLLTSIFGWAMGEFINRAKSELAELEDPREKLRRFAHLHFLLLEQERDIAIVFQIELRQSTKFMEQFSTTYLAQYLQMLREIIEEGQRSRDFQKAAQLEGGGEISVRRAGRDGDQLGVEPQKSQLDGDGRAGFGHISERR